MKNVSLYRDLFGQVEGEAQRVTGMLSRAELDSPSLKYETKVPQLEYMCLIMENMVITKKPKALIYAGFQKLSRCVEPVLERFMAMAESAEKVYIFGENDKDMPAHPNIEYIALPEGHPLIREWFLVIHAPTMKMMMTAYDLDGFGTHEVEEGRNFRGIKSIQPKLVDQAAALLEGCVPA
ncbi:DICT sensory domain-containing protein [Paenibacillus aurantius]|uniref:DICT sensory domain-containing protein n=1 Tax=Paenibacillus aurantius TaxID=2918900 RepID=A0AA96RHN5_9BACL|nr:DICT sensory domain-containing protein [Paenibacillus aurantius]WNQ11309.1 DICT sensory domain-containing protein [Paenibacillus aurantius]